MQVGDLMTKNVISVHPQMSIDRVAAVLFDNNLTGAPVLDDQGKIVGIVTEYDFFSPDLKVHIPTYINLLKLLRVKKNDQDSKDFLAGVEELGRTKVENIMTRDVVTVKANTDVAALIDLIINQRINPVPVVDEQNNLVGIVSRADLVKLLKQHYHG